MMIDERDYLYLKQILKERSGLALTDGKEYLLEGRLLPVARSLGFGSLAELVQHIRTSRSEIALTTVVDAMTTNETLFFRDSYPFTSLVSVMLPSLTAARAPEHTIRIWSTAASAGQEPYSIAMQIKEHPELSGGRPIEIVASDISSEMINRAEAGFYTDFEVRRGLSPNLLGKYFVREDAGWRIVPEIRRMVKFMRVNLLDHFDNLGLYDIVFCRNVLIYFDNNTKLDIVERIADRLRPDGFLVVGGAETLVGLTDRFRPCSEHRGLFQPSSFARAPMRAIGEGAASDRQRPRAPYPTSLQRAE